MQVFYARGVTKRRVRVEQTKNAIKSYGRSLTSRFNACLSHKLITDRFKGLLDQQFLWGGNDSGVFWQEKFCEILKEAFPTNVI